MAARVDFERLESWMGSKDAVWAVLDIFVSDAPKRLASLRAKHAAGDLAGACLEAHSMKGAARNLGLEALAQRCESLEARAKVGDAPAVATGIEEVASNLAEAIRHIADERASARQDVRGPLAPPPDR